MKDVYFTLFAVTTYVFENLMSLLSRLVYSLNFNILLLDDML